MSLATPGIEERIVARRHELSPQERKAAQTVLADLARVSRATMSRLFGSLGFGGFDEVRDTCGRPARARVSTIVAGYRRLGEIE